MGKHDVIPAGNINEALERHYQKRIEQLETAIEAKDAALKDASMALDRFGIRLQEKDAYIEELRSALVEMTVKATMGGK